MKLYLIEILHQTTTSYIRQRTRSSCILSKFYIKPQLRENASEGRRSCILSKFYIKPQHIRNARLVAFGCILSKFYIKPQLSAFRVHHVRVVSYRNSTSNHNNLYRWLDETELYLIEILHQTTTISTDGSTRQSCILSKFYIKPQQVNAQLTTLRVVSYRNSTSNHNGEDGSADISQVVSYRNSTSNHNFLWRKNIRGFVVSYRNSTSNHNSGLILIDKVLLTGCLPL